MQWITFVDTMAGHSRTRSRIFVDSRDNEISNVDEWSRANNLTLNHAKSVKIIFRDNRKRCCIHPPSPLQGIARVTSHLLTDCLSLRTWMTSSARLRGPCTPSAYSGFTACRRQLCSRCSARSSSLSSGVVGLYLSTDIVSMLFCVELLGLTCGH